MAWYQAEIFFWVGKWEIPTIVKAQVTFLIFVGFGIFSFFWGFGRLRRKRLIENIPTSTVRSLAMGLVELLGKARAGQKIELKSPFSLMDCVYYRYAIERREKSGKKSQWVTILEGDSSCVSFYLDDGTGEVMVSPQGAEMILPADYEFVTGSGNPLPQNLISFMENSGLAYRSFFGGAHRLRFREWYICPGEQIYVLGTAKKSSDFIGGHKEKLTIRLRELKQDSTKMSEIDLNKDGEISAEEWDIARAKIEQALLEEAVTSADTGELADVTITKGDTEKVFIISDHSQKELIEKLFYRAMLGIYGGAILTIFGLANFLKNMGILRF